MTNQNLFKEAIADAKQVREAALATAKAALTEALTPKLQSMLAAKLEEIDSNEELDENKDTQELDEDIDLSSILAELDNETDDSSEATDMNENEELDENEELEEKKDDETAEEAAEEKDDETDETEETSEEDEKVKDLSVEDLKTIIKDIVSQELGGGAGAGDEMNMDMGSEEDTAVLPPAGEEGEGDSDEVDLEELLAELDALDENKDEELDEAKKKDKEDKKKKDAKKELDEAIKVINVLRKELNETNLLNAKLLYVNKIFKAKNLNESQKLKVISAFDKATTPKEAKVVFESLNTGLSSTPKKKSIKESLGFASKPAGNAPNKNIVETDEVVSRWQKLANIK